MNVWLWILVKLFELPLIEHVVYFCFMHLCSFFKKKKTNLSSSCIGFCKYLRPLQKNLSSSGKYENPFFIFISNRVCNVSFYWKTEHELICNEWEAPVLGLPSGNLFDSKQRVKAFLPSSPPNKRFHSIRRFRENNGKMENSQRRGRVIITVVVLLSQIDYCLETLSLLENCLPFRGCFLWF